MKLVKFLVAAAVLATSMSFMPKAQASARDAQAVAAIVGAIALVKIATDLEPVHDNYWDYRGSDRCYYKEIRTEDMRTSCHERRHYYYNGSNYECVTVTTYGRDFVRSCY